MLNSDIFLIDSYKKYTSHFGRERKQYNSKFMRQSLKDIIYCHLCIEAHFNIIITAPFKDIKIMKKSK